MSNQYLKLRRSNVPGKIPSTSSIDYGEIALNTYDGLAYMKVSGSNGEEVVPIGSSTGSFTGNFTGTFTGSLQGTASWAEHYNETDPVFTAVSGTFATTGSNTFVGDQIINGENLGLIVDAGGLKRVGFMKYGGIEGSIARVANQNFRILRTTGSNINDGTNAITDFYIAGDGKVGIGTTTPAYTLDVSGSSNFNGDQTITGSLSQGLGIASGSYSHAEGESTIASGSYSHAEGSVTKAIGDYSHAEGDNTQAKGNYSHAEGQETMTLASGQYSHAEGFNTIASANYQHVQGQFNATSSVPAAFIVGNGTDDSNRSNLIHAAGNEVQITGSLNVSQGITGSLLGTSSFANSASWAINAVTASFAPNIYNSDGTIPVPRTITFVGNSDLTFTGVGSTINLRT